MKKSKDYTIVALLIPFTIAVLSCLPSCTKENIQQEATCDFIFDKYYQWYPATPTDTTYFFRMAKDTMPGIQPPGTFYVLQVSKSVYQTITLPRLTRYCY